MPAGSPPDLVARAAGHGDEHVIKLADTVVDVGDERAMVAGKQAAELIPPLFESGVGMARNRAGG